MHTAKTQHQRTLMAARWDSRRVGAYPTARARPGARQTWAQRNWERLDCEHYCTCRVRVYSITSYTELQSSCARHGVQIHISTYEVRRGYSDSGAISTKYTSYGCLSCRLGISETFTPLQDSLTVGRVLHPVG